MSVVTYSTRGLTQLKAKLAKAAAESEHVRWKHLQKFGDLVMADSQKRFVPVDHDDLRKTGKVDQAGNLAPGVVGVRLSYGGGGPEAEYAIAVHEHLSEFSPPSWQNTTVHFTRGGPKYLELPVMEHSGNLPNVGVEVMLELFTGVSRVV